MKRIVILGFVILAVASCGRISSTFGIGAAGAKGPRNVEINDRRFKTSIDTGEDKRDFTVTVTPVSVDRAAAMEAARYKATVYCLRRYGGSDAEWTSGPDQPLDQLHIVDDKVSLQGRCTQR